MSRVWMANASMGSDKLFKTGSTASRPISIPSQHTNPYYPHVESWIENRIHKVNRKHQMKMARRRLRQMCLCISAVLVFLLFAAIVGIIIWVILANKDNSAGYCMLIAVDEQGLGGGSFPSSLSSTSGKEFQSKFCSGMTSVYGSTMTGCSIAFIELEACFAVVDARMRFKFEDLEKRVLEENKLLTNDNVAAILQVMFNEGQAKSEDAMMPHATFLKVDSCKVTGTITYKYEVNTLISGDNLIHNSVNSPDSAKKELCIELEYALSASTLGNVYKKCTPWSTTVTREDSQIRVVAEFEITYDKETLLEAAKNRDSGETVKGYTKNQVTEQIKKKPTDYPLIYLIFIEGESALDTSDTTTTKDEEQKTEHNTYSRNTVTTKRTKCKLQ